MKRNVLLLFSVLVLTPGMACESNSVARRAQPLIHRDQPYECPPVAGGALVQRAPASPLKTGTDDGRRYF